MTAQRVLIAFEADRFFWVIGNCRRYLDRAVFRFFGHADIDIAARAAIGIDCVEKADPLVCFRGTDTSELLFFQRFFGECGRRKAEWDRSLSQTERTSETTA
jgi:hypothetical protein